eukprot:1313499-Prymnesium_polylepis.1
MGDVEAAAKQEFRVDLNGKLAELQPAMESSRVHFAPTIADHFDFDGPRLMVCAAVCAATGNL